MESQGLLAQASQEKLRRDQMVGQREQFEMVGATEKKSERPRLRL